MAFKRLCIVRRIYERLRRQAMDLERVGREAIDRRLLALVESFERLLGG